ncbi:PorT family protein [Parabacteroides sp. 52]|uniref:porin family protein n=1 Tax=unclassified Parabacteroides TaxID=2649774 RepID=UPI0013CFB916|nr:MULTISPECIES: porin family protein [unclassified Parabacteroides]MDH6535606.1 hypothetical protein [Parabacteroides sp. PM5-20]NDV55471.1 PorT family protein [Parabacteroides sp. 52]
MRRERRKIGLSLIVVMLMAILPATAQVAFGVRAGASYSSLTQKVGTTYESGARMGYSIAGMMDIPLYRRFSLRPEIAFANQGGAWYSVPEMGNMALRNRCWYYSLQVPVNLAFTFPIMDVRVSILCGPVADFSLFGRMTSRQTGEDLVFGNTQEKDLKPFDLAVNAGLAVEYKRYFFSINSLCGTFDRRAVKREGESRLFQNNVTFSLGYFFRPAQ